MEGRQGEPENGVTLYGRYTSWVGRRSLRMELPYMEGRQGEPENRVTLYGR